VKLVQIAMEIINEPHHILQKPDAIP